MDDIGLHVVSVAKRCRDRGIGVCGPGQRFNLIGQTVRYLLQLETRNTH